MEGFIPWSRANNILNLITIAMIIILPILAWSIWQVKIKKNYNLHKKLQITISLSLLVLVFIFELNIRKTDWRVYAKPSIYYDTILLPFLTFHIVIASATFLIWLATLRGALKYFSNEAIPNQYSKHHKWLGRIGTLLMCTTAITGWIFYYLAFVA